MPFIQQTGAVGAKGPIKPFEFFTVPGPSNAQFPPEFVAPMYDMTGVGIGLQPPGFDFTATQGFLNQFGATTESNYGDSVEVPPTLKIASDQILMGYTGYRIKTSSMVDPNDESHFPIVTQQIVLQFWDGEDQQFNNGSFVPIGMLQLTEYGLGDVTELPIIPISPYDTDTDDQQVMLDSNYAYGMMGIAELALGDNPEVFTIPLIIQGTDAEQQLSNDYNVAYGMMQLAEASIGDYAENVPSIPAIIQLTDAEYQLLNPDYYKDQDEFQDRSIFITLPYAQFIDEERNQFWTEYNIANLASDAGDWADLIVYSNGVIKGWDTDADNQLSNQTWFSSDTLMDEEIESITRPPAPIIGIDNDVENQIPTTLYNVDRDLMDTGVELITLPFLAEVFDEERQQFSNEKINANIGSDSGQDTTNFIIQPPADWTLDAEQQLQQQPFNTDRELSDSTVENIIIPAIGYDHDGDAQIPTPQYATDRDLSDTSVENIIIPAMIHTTDAEQQKLQAEYYKDHLMDEEVELITIPPIVFALYAWDSDAEQQFSNEIKYAYCEDPTDRGVRIFIPIQDLTPVEDNQESNQVQFSNDTLSDETVEKITLNPVAPTNVYDNDADNQLPMNMYTPVLADDQETKEGTKQIILPPFINIIDGDVGGDEDE